MNIKSLLLGSAAALAAVSGAQAADAIVAVEPEPVEYVRVCDTFGTGFFYIPGTETCLRVGGYLRFQVDAGSDYGWSRRFNNTITTTLADERLGGRNYLFGNNGDWNAHTRARLFFDARNETELGTLRSFIAAHWDISRTWTGLNNSRGATEPYIDEAYIQLGGFKVGSYLNWWDSGLKGETDDIDGNTQRLTSVSYTYNGDGFYAGLQLDELSRGVGVGRGQGLGLEAIIGTEFAGIDFNLLGSYDFQAEEGAIRALLEAEVGPGTLGIAAIWSSGEGKFRKRWTNPTAAPGLNTWGERTDLLALYSGQAYYNTSEWTLAASYEWKVTDKLSLTPGFQYYWNLASVGEFDRNQRLISSDFKGGNTWRAGLTADYKIVDGLAAKVSVQYNDDYRVGSYKVDDNWTGFVRLQRSF